MVQCVHGKHCVVVLDTRQSSVIVTVMMNVSTGVPRLRDIAMRRLSCHDINVSRRFYHYDKLGLTFLEMPVQTNHQKPQSLA